MAHRRAFFPKCAIALASGILILVAILTIVLNHSDCKTVVERLATYHFGRAVKIGAMHITYDHSIKFELDDVHIANANWGSDPDILRFAHLEGELDIVSLIKGPFHFQHLILDDAHLILERNIDGIGNWKSGKEAELYKSHPDNPKEAARSRHRMPTILDLIMRNGHINFRTSSGNTLRIDLNNLKLSTVDDDQPIRLLVEGTYNQHPVQFDITTDSFNALHNVGKPFLMKIKAEGGDGLVALEAQSLDPINFDDFHGMLDMSTKNLGAMVVLFGEEFRGNLPARLSGRLERHNDEWKLDKVEGSLADSHFKDDVLLTEGPRHSADKAQVNIVFDTLNLDNLLTKMGVQKPADSDVLMANAAPDPMLDAKIAASTIKYRSLEMRSFKSHIQIAPSLRSIKDVSFEWLGGKASGSIQSAASIRGNKTLIDGALLNADARPFFKLLGFGENLTGKMEGHIHLSGEAENLDDLKRHGNGEALLVIKNGFMQKVAFEDTAFDVHALFDKNTDMTPLSCLLVTTTMDNGEIFVAPIEIKTDSGIFFGGGSINMQDQKLDFNFKAEKTGTMALDLPIHISGDIKAPNIGLGSSDTIEQLKNRAPANINRLSSSNKLLASESGCL